MSPEAPPTKLDGFLAALCTNRQATNLGQARRKLLATGRKPLRLSTDQSPSGRSPLIRTLPETTAQRDMPLTLAQFDIRGLLEAA